MKPRQLFFALLLLICSPLANSQAQENVRSALYFAEHENWMDAKLQADISGDAGLKKLIQWLYVLNSESGASFEDITVFISENPDWPDQKQMRIRAEQSLRDASPLDNDVTSWFTTNPPITGIGKLTLAGALQRQNQADEPRLQTLVKEAWKLGDFDADFEEHILAQYGQWLVVDDHIARIDRLLWEEKTGAAKRLMDKVPQAQQLLFTARMALIDDKKNAVNEVAKVPAALKHDAGLTYDRMRYRARKGDDKGVREMLLMAPKTLPYPEKWWRQRELQTREAIDEHQYALAEKLIEHHGLSEGSEFADALWLQGWLQLEFLKNPAAAYDFFYRMFSAVRYPVSKARAAYWAARAAEASGDKESAESWYNTASAYPTAFYGQLASLRINGTAPLRIPAQREIPAEDQHRFDASALADAIRVAAANGRLDLASKLVTGAIENTKNEDDAVMLAAMGKVLERPYLSVRGAKKAQQQQNLMLVKLGYPIPATPYDIALERSLALAITRQESEFDPNAKSPSGALGMMQLLPSTAKEVARKNDLPYAASKLYEPDYNWTLGSLYLDRLINGYNGSYIMAAAAYNAGPGNVRKWIAQFGTPGNNSETAINWVEKIPFSETRNYVQRVMENLQIYRHIEAGDTPPKLLLSEDLVR